MTDINQKLIEKTKKWLGKEGIKFFTECFHKYGTVSPIIMEEIDAGYSYPHPVHFREGMQIRNFLRSTNLCKNWSDDDFDNKWGTVVKLAIEIDDESC